MALHWKLEEANAEILLLLANYDGCLKDRPIAKIYQYGGGWKGEFLGFFTESHDSILETKEELLGLIRHVSRVINYRVKIGHSDLLDD
jgi:hypothetical protein